LRIFLQDGSEDLNNSAGDWWIANQSMERALTFAGYEVNHAWGEGGHNTKHSSSIFPDALRWLWKDWPAPIKTGAGSPQLQEILIPGEDWQQVGEGYHWAEGPAANAQGEIFFNDLITGKTYQVNPDGPPSVYIGDSRKANGQAFGPDGRLYAVATAEDSIFAYDANKQRTKIADGIHGNDIVVLHDGRIYISAPESGEPTPGKVWFVSPTGEKKLVDTGLRYPNGIAVSPDQSLLYVGDYRSHWVYSYHIQPDGTLADKERYYWLHYPDSKDDSGADGMRVDTEGRLYVTTYQGIQVCDQAGRVNCIIPTPNGVASNVCFGGKDFDVLYATCGDKVYRRKLKTHGAPAWQPPRAPEIPEGAASPAARRDRAGNFWP
jgi:sugar lactone lactonase YvrE